MPGVGLGVPVVGALGLLAVAEAAVQHHHQRGRLAQPLRPVQVIGAGRAARLQGVGGWPDRNRLGVRRSQRMPATEAAGEHDDQNRQQTEADRPGASESHRAMVAAGGHFDK
ncbi:hypothetical protein MAHJHV61_28920 [Mycobacterium avium subsp. hominissuis]